MRENAFQRKLLLMAKKARIFARKVETPGVVGFPDLVLIGNGVTVFVEVKRPDGKGRLSRHQEITISDMREHGGKVYVIDDAQQFTDLIEREFKT
jgi:hypothetical protein